MKLGIDKGSVLTKTTAFTLRSTVKELGFGDDITEIERNGTTMTINKRDYLFGGGGGDFALDMAKGIDKTTKLLVYAAIILSRPSPKEKVDIVVGIPCGMYKLQKEEIIENIMSPEPIPYMYKEESQFRLGRVTVFPESMGVFYSQDTAKYAGKKILIVDIGGISMDVSLFEDRKLVSFDSYPLGIMKLFSKMATEVNRLYQTEYTEWDMDRILNKGLVIDGQVIRRDFLDELRLEHTKMVYQRIKREYDVRSLDEVPLAGGGGELLHEGLYDLIPQAFLVPNPIMANVNGFQRVAEVVYNEGN